MIRREKTVGRRLPTVRQLRYFVALERCGHFGRAAAECFVSQSAFSVAIQELETTLGVRLVDRTNRQVTVTPLGHQVADQARLCLRDLEQLADLAAEGRKPLSGRLTLGVIPTIAPFLLPQIMPRVREAFPELRLYIREDRTEALKAQLASGELDLVLLALPWPLGNLRSMPLFTDRFMLACRRDTRLIDPQNFSVNRVTAESILLLEDGHCLRDHAIEACELRATDAVNRFAATSLFTLLEMVDQDLGVTYLPEMAADSALLRQTQIETWPLEKTATREIALAWRSGTGREEEFSALGELIRNSRALSRSPA